MAHLLNELTLIPDRNGKAEEELTDLLETMKENGEVAIERRGRLWDGVTYLGFNKPIPEPACDRTSVSAGSIWMPDEGVTVREEFEMSEVLPQKGNSRADNVNAALKVLREAADPVTGEIRQVSAAAIIAEKLGVSMAVANNLNGDLGKLELRLTEGAKSTLVHLIDMSDRQATKDALEALEAKEEAPEVSPQTDTPEEQVELSVVTVSEASAPEEELVDIIEDLDGKLTKALEDVDRLTTENGQLKELLRIQNEAVVKSAETVEQLTRQLNTPRVSDRVANTLKKYKRGDQTE